MPSTSPRSLSVAEEELTALRTRVDQLELALQRAESALREVSQRIERAMYVQERYQKWFLDSLPEDPNPMTEQEMQDLIDHGVTWDVIEKDLKELLEG